MSGKCRHGQLLTCTTCWQAWEHFCDVAERWFPFVDGVDPHLLLPWQVKALRAAMRAAAAGDDPDGISHVAPSSWQSLVRLKWLRIDAGADPGKRYVVLYDGQRAHANHMAALRARKQLSLSQLAVLRNAAAGVDLGQHLRGRSKHGAHLQVVASLQSLRHLDDGRKITAQGIDALRIHDDRARNGSA